MMCRATVVFLLLALAAPVDARAACNSFVASVCDPPAPVALPDAAPPDVAQPGAVAPVTPPATPRVIRVTPRPPPFAVGDTFPLAEHSPLMNPERFDLPPAGGGWRYYRIRPDVFRVDTATGRVLEIVTGGNRRMLR
jgi:hypothetical protein